MGERKQRHHPGGVTVDAEELEALVRRVIREELHRFHVGGIRAPKVVEAPRRGAIRYDDPGMQNIRRVAEYTEQIDPDNKMPKDELLHLLRMKFPEFDL